MTTSADVLTQRDAALTGPFWTAAAERRLVRPVCRDCRRSHFTPKWSCPHCRSENWTWQTSGGRGRVYSSTVVHRGPDGSWPTPYVLAIVDLDGEGWSMLSRLVDVGDIGGDLSTRSFAGRAVGVRFVAEGRDPHRTMPVFSVSGDAA